MAATIQIIANLQNNAASPIKALRSDIEGLGTGAEKASGGFSKLQTVGAAATGAIIAGVAAAGVAIGSFTVKAVQMAADMEAQISGIAAVWNQTADAIAPIKDLVQDLGLDPNLKVTAVEAAAAIEMLAKNGLTMDQVLQGAAHATVLLANATGGDFELAANVATDTMALFGISAENMKQAVDGITSVTVASKFALEDYALAIAQGGGVASQMGVSFDDFNTAIVATAAYFKSGSDAGTSFKTFLQRLIPVSTKSADVMKELGIITADGSNRFYDANGNLRSMAQIAGVLNGALAGLTEEQRNHAMTVMFGADAMRFAGGIAKYSAKEFRELQKVMGETDALEQAKTRVDNFRGAWEIFLGVIEGLQLQLGSALLPMLRIFVEFLTGQLVTVGSALIDKFALVSEAFNMFIEALGEGASPIQAIMGLVQQIGLVFGLTMEQATNLGKAVSGVIAFIVQAATSFGNFISQFLSWKDVLAGIAIAIASFVLPLIYGLVTGFLSLIAPVLAVIAVVALLRNIWERNLLGIRTAVEGLFGVLETLANYFRIVLTDGDYLNDFLANLPAPIQGIVEKIGILVSFFREFIDNLRSGEGVMSSITQLIMNVGFAFGMPAEKVGQLMVGFNSFVTMIQNMFEPTLERIRTALTNLGTNMEPVREKLSGLWEALKNLATSVGQFLLPVLAVLGGVLLTVGKFLGEVFAGLLENAGKILGGVVDFIIGQLNGLSSLITGIVNVVKAILEGDWEGAWEAAKEAVSGWWEAVKQSLDGVAQVIDGVVGAIWDAIANLAEDLLGKALPSWDEFKQGILDKIAEIPSGITESIADWTAAVQEVIQAIKDAFTGEGEWSDVGAAVMDLIKQSFETSVKILSEAWTVIKDSLFDWAEGESWGDVADKIIEEVGAALSDAADAIKDQLSSWQEAIFDWAEAEDWQGVADTIAEKVGTALSDAADAIKDQLTTWRDAIFEWAEGENWEDVGNKIADLVGQALGSAADVIGGQLESWKQAIFDWVGAESWDEVGFTIVEKVIEGLTEFAQNASSAVSEWFDALVDAINGIDWYQIGYDIVFFVIDGLKEFVTNVATTVSEWYTAIQTETAGKSWTEIAGLIVAAIVLGLANFIAEVATTVYGWFTALRDEIIIMQASFQGLGMSIINGIIAGITAAQDSIRQALVGIALGALQAAKDALGIKSPSTVFAAQVGQPISQGVALGILQAGNLPVDAIMQVAGNVETEGAKAFGEAMKAIAEGLAAGMNAILDLSAFPGVGVSFLDNLKSVVSMLGLMVSEVNTANVYGEDALKLLKSFVEIAAGIADLIAPLITALTEISFFHGMNLDGFLAGIIQLSTLLGITVSYLMAANVYADMALESLSLFLDVVGQIAEIVGPFLAALQDINAFGIAHLDFFHEGVKHLWYTMMVLVLQLQELAVYGAETLARMENLLSTVEAIADLVAPFIAALYELNAFGAAQLDHFHEGVAQLAYVIRVVTIALMEANTFSGLALEQVQNLVETVSAIAEMISPLIAGLLSLNALTGPATDIALESLLFRNAIMTLVDTLSTAAELFSTGLLQHVREFAETAGAIADLIGPAVESLYILKDITGDIADIALQSVYFRNALETLVFFLADGAELFTGSLLQHVQVFAETAGKIVDLIAPAVQGLQIISTLTGDIADIALQAVYFRNAIYMVVVFLADAAQLFSSELLAHVQTFAETAGDVLELVSDGIDALAALAMYVAAAGLDSAAKAFAADLTTVILTLVTALQAAGILANQAVIEAGELADGINDLLGMVADGVEAIAALSTYVPIANAQAAVNAFAADLVTIILTLVDALKASGILANQAVAAAGELADGIGDILDLVEPAIEAVVFLVGYTQIGGLREATEAFAKDLAVMVQSLADGLREAGVLANAAVIEAGEMAGHLTDLLDVVEPAIGEDGAIKLLAGYTSSGGLREAAQRFVTDLIAVTQTLVDGLTQSTLAAGVALQKASEIADHIDGLLGVIEPAIDAIKALAEYSSKANLAEKVNAFVSDLTTVANTLVIGLTGAANALGQTAVAAATAFAEAIKKIAELVRDAVAAMDTLADAKMPNVQPVLDYIIKSSAEIAAAAQASGSIGAAANYMAIFAIEVNRLVDEVFAALHYLETLANANVPGSVQSILSAMVDAFKSGTGNFTGAGQSLAQAVIDGFNTGNYEGSGKEAVDNFVAGLKSQEGAAAQAAVGLVLSMLSAAINAAKAFSQLGKDIVAAIVSGIQSVASQVTAAVIKLVQEAISAGKGAAAQASVIGQDMGKAASAGLLSMTGSASSAGASFGSAMMAGLKQAIAAGQSSVVGQINSTVSAAINAAEKTLGIASPSKVFFRIGEFLTEGLRSGLEGSAAPVVRAVGNMAREVTQTMSDGLRVSIPAVSLPAAMLPAPVSVSGVTPRSVMTQPIINPYTPYRPAHAAVSGFGQADTIYNDIQVTVSFPNGTTATAADIKTAVKTAVEEALLKSGQKVDASRRLR